MRLLELVGAGPRERESKVDSFRLKVYTKNMDGFDTVWFDILERTERVGVV